MENETDMICKMFLWCSKVKMINKIVFNIDKLYEISKAFFIHLVPLLA